MPSRFAQLLLLCLVVVFLPTFLYLRPSANSPRNQYAASTSQWYGSAGSVPGKGDTANVGTTQGQGPLAQDEVAGNGWKWPDSLVDPAKLKAGDYWKSWKESWKSSHPPTEPAKIAANPLEAPALPHADGSAAFAPKMGNETAKAELGRATWRFLHTMTLRFPDKPTKEQRQTLSTFIHTFSLLYPCEECANHFQQLLKELPPQTSSRMAASLWLCAAHNRVNARLGKPEFPCDKLDSTYDCGCGPESLPTIAPAPPAVPAGPQLPRGATQDRSEEFAAWLSRRTDDASCGLCQIRA